MGSLDVQLSARTHLLTTMQSEEQMGLVVPSTAARYISQRHWSFNVGFPLEI